ncbi:hypothetical protein [Alteribacter aurantiacus]|uniref:hypothetical protein n=1 Tax=Alteribacter aurantiacus TaxID=254410 RepID=UPI0004244004|nr:hypothetical protein [Alteribacter aurantiacus]
MKKILSNLAWWWFIFTVLLSVLIAPAFGTMKTILYADILFYVTLFGVAVLVSLPSYPVRAGKVEGIILRMVTGVIAVLILWALVIPSIRDLPYVISDEYQVIEGIVVDVEAKQRTPASRSAYTDVYFETVRVRFWNTSEEFDVVGKMCRATRTPHRRLGRSLDCLEEKTSP